MKNKLLAMLCVVAVGIPTVAMATGCDLGGTGGSSSSSQSSSSILEAKEYTVKFVDENGAVLKEGKVEEGDIPEAPTAMVPENTAEYTYRGAWDKTIVVATADTTYTWVVSQTKNSYLVKFVDGEGNTLKEETLEYGATPVAPTATAPSNTAEYTYTAAWDKEIAAVTGEATYTWVVSATRNKYKVTFDGGEAVEYEYGAIVTPPTATKDGCIFDGWSVNGDKVDITTYQITGETAFVSEWKEGLDFTVDMGGASIEGDEEATVLQSDAVFVGGISYMIAAEDKDVAINLPKFNYGNYSEVTFDIHCSTFCFIGPSANVRAYSNEGDYITGTVKIVPTQVYLAVIMTVDGTDYATYVTDAEVINGTKALSFSAHTLVENRYFNISAFTVSHEPTDYVGPAMATDGTICGHSTSSLIEGGYNYDLGNGGRIKAWTILLTAVDYSQYKSVTYQYKGSEAWMTIGFWNGSEKGDAIAGASAFIEGTITVTNNEGIYTVTINDTATGKSVSMELTDTRIISGEKAFCIYVNNGAAYRQFNISKPVCSNQ